MKEAGGKDLVEKPREKARQILSAKPPSLDQEIWTRSPT
jgi:hypothetical protein